MTNRELVKIFMSIEMNTDNILDIYTKLSDYSAEYKKLPIAKIKPTIYDAYELYFSHKNRIQEFVTAITTADFSNVVEAFNFDKIKEQIPQEFMPVFEKLIKDAGLE